MEKGEKLSEFDKSFGLFSLLRSKLLSCVLLVEQVLEALLHGRRQLEASELCWDFDSFNHHLSPQAIGETMLPSASNSIGAAFGLTSRCACARASAASAGLIQISPTSRVFR